MNGTLSAVVTFALPRAVKVTVTVDTLSVDLEDGRTVSVPIGWYPRLAHGTPKERVNVQIGGAGFGLHWRDLDEGVHMITARRGKVIHVHQYPFDTGERFRAAWGEGRQKEA